MATHEPDSPIDRVVTLDMLRVVRGAHKLCYCRKPRSFLVDEAGVYCKACGAPVDPHAAIWELAQNHERLAAEAEKLRALKRDLETWHPQRAAVKRMEHEIRKRPNAPEGGEGRDDERQEWSDDASGNAQPRGD